MMRARLTGLTVAVALLCSACGIPAVMQPGRSVVPTEQARILKTFPAAAVFDYQIGGPYAPAANVAIVDRDRSQKGVEGRFNICYVNAYQVQPGEVEMWKKDHPTLLLRDRTGALVMDEEWNEPLLDISTAAKRTELAKIVGILFAGCARFGHDAVEPDNLDSYTRSKGLLRQSDAVAFATELVRQAHTYKMLIGQKNDAEIAPRLSKSGYDFAIVEECQQYAECSAYTDVYGKKVIEIEYDAKSFAAACKARAGKVSLLLRDRDVVAKGKPGYVSKTC